MFLYLGTRFDLEAKKLRFIAVLAMYVASFFEIFTLCMPFYFLFFASFANLIKNIAWIILSATRASQLVQMSRSGNLGDLTAKMGSQGTASSLVGTMLGVSLSSFLGLSEFSSFAILFGGVSIVGIFSLYRSTSFMVTNTLNRERLNILLDYFWIRFSDHMAAADDPWHEICKEGCDVEDGFILSMDQVSVEESFVSPIIRWNYLPHVKVNPHLGDPKKYEIFMAALEKIQDKYATKLENSFNYTTFKEDYVKGGDSLKELPNYILSVDPLRRKPIYVWLTEASTPEDHIEAYFMCYILEKFHFDMKKFEGLQGLYRSWRKTMQKNGWNLDKFYYPEMEKQLVRLSIRKDV